MGKEVEESNLAFEELKVYTDRYYAGEESKKEVVAEAYRQLSKHNVRLRQDDGMDPKLTISVPKVGNVLIVGVRYIKESGRNTEDHFIFRPNTNIYRCRGKELDKLYPEYKGSHIQQLGNTSN